MSHHVAPSPEQLLREAGPRVTKPDPAGRRGARYELCSGDNHHHVVCRGCGAVDDVDCATGDAPCFQPQGVSNA